MTKTDDVKEFMLAMDQEVRDEATVMNDIEKWQRFAMLNEEFSEHKQALAAVKKATEYHSKTGTKKAMTDLADSLVDMVYVAIGTALAYGFDFDELWRLVHENNLTKRDPVTGKVIKANGKTQKPEGFVPVDLQSSIYPCKH